MLWGKLLLSLLGLACGHRLALASARGEGNDELSKRVKKLENAMTKLLAQQELGEMNTQAEQEDLLFKIKRLEERVQHLEADTLEPPPDVGGKYAVEEGHSETPEEVPMMSEAKKEDTKAVQEDKEEQLRSAAAEGDSMWVRKLLEERVDPAAKDGSGRTALHWAARENQVASAQELLKDSELTDENVRYALLRMEDKDGNEPLHLAAIFGKAEVAKVLIQEGADLTTKNNQGLSPKQLADKENLYGDRAAIKAAFAFIP